MGEDRRALLVLVGRRDWFERECFRLLGMKGMKAEVWGLALWVSEGNGGGWALRGRNARLAVLMQPGARVEEDTVSEIKTACRVYGEAGVAEVQGMAAAMADLDELKRLGT